MTLLEKFEEFTEQKSYERTNYDAKECEKIADDYAVEFAVWVAKEFWSSPNCKYSEVQTSKELLEVFKKEKGL
jgi:hypothetical protein